MKPVPNQKNNALGTRKGSVMMGTVVMVLVAGFASLSWSAYIGNAHRAAIRDRDQLSAFYASEAGIELIVDLFNNPFTYVGDIPDDYTSDLASHPAAYPGGAPVAPADGYALFSPYIVSYALDDEGNALYRDDGTLVVTSTSFFRDPNAGSNAAVSRSSKIPTFTLDIRENVWVEFKADNGTELARIEQIEIFNPADLENLDELTATQRIICVVRSTGVTPTGVRMAVQSIITENPTYDVRSPGAIISRASADFNGNFNVHWGELWTRGDINLPTNYVQKAPRYNPNVDYDSKDNEDRWFRMRTEGWIKNSAGSKYADGRDKTGFANAAPATSVKQYTQPFHPTGMNGALKNHGGFENMYQNQTLTFPEYDYHEWKNFVRSYGFRYFYTNANGTLFGMETDPESADYGRMVGKSYDDWFGADPSSEDYWDIKNLVAFIDTVPTNDAGQTGPSVDGVPVINSTYYPRSPADGGKLSTIKIAGGSLHTRGAIFVAANMDMTGQGNPPNWTSIPESAGGGVRMPNEEPPTGETIKLFHHGLLYSWGSVSGAGNRTIFGSIFTEGGYAGSGTPAVYYNYRMRDGSWLNLNVSRVSRTLWDVTTPPELASN